MITKKDVKPLNVRIDTELFERFDTYCRDKGQAKTVALPRILEAYMDEYEKEAESKKK